MEEKHKILLDTSAYSFFASGNEPRLWAKMWGSQKCAFYGFEVVRHELAETPKWLMLGTRRFRDVLLEYYDTLGGHHSFQNNFLIESLAREYMHNYHGGRPAQDLLNDFLIVACASFHGLDVVVSEDRATMLSGNAIRTYKQVNARAPGLKNPRFLKAKQVAALL